jgi:hypothetical protein
MNWLYYLLEANLYLTLFYGFYRLFLHKETFYVLNRYYLILTSLTAFLLPLLQLGFLNKDIIQIESGPQEVQQDKSLFTAENALLLIYALIALFFLCKVIWGFKHIIKLLKESKKRIEGGVTVVELTNTKTAFSFFNFLFIDPELPQRNTILNHEMAHIKQKHSIDVVLFEIIGSLSWFNPITYFLKNDIKLLHEFLADEETTGKGIEKYEYAIFLIQNSYGNQSIKFTNQIFNSSILKRRISMLNQKKSAKWARLRLLLVLPITGSMLCASTMAFTKDYGVVDLYPKNTAGYLTAPQDTLKKKKVKEIEILPAPPLPGQKSKVKGIKIAPPPPPVEPRKGVKFPPPIIKGDKKLAPPPPPIERKSKKQSNKEIVVVGYSAPPVEPKPQVVEVEIKEPDPKLKPIKVKGYQTPPPPPPPSNPGPRGIEVE